MEGSRVFHQKFGYGKIIFIDLKDGYGSIQIALRSDLLSDNLFKILKFIDIGDFR